MKNYNCLASTNKQKRYKSTLNEVVAYFQFQNYPKSHIDEIIEITDFISTLPIEEFEKYIANAGEDE